MSLAQEGERFCAETAETRRCMKATSPRQRVVIDILGTWKRYRGDLRSYLHSQCLRNALTSRKKQDQRPNDSVEMNIENEIRDDSRRYCRRCLGGW